jgi:rhamnose transport system ATP-binding protein
VTKPPEPIIELNGIAKQFGGVQALRGVDFRLFPGEVHALVGENGAGKSTLVKILAGIYRPDVGVVKVGGEIVELRSPTPAQALGIAVVQQEPMMFPDLDVAEHVFMGRHPRDHFGRVDWKRMYKELFAIVKQLRERGVAVLFVSHRLEEVFMIADRLTVFRDGTHIITALVSEMTTDEIIKHMVGRELSNLFPKGEAEIGEVVLDVHHLTRPGVFSDVSFQLRRGEILGLSGLVGAGRTEVAQVLFGIDQAESGEIWLKGKKVHIRSPQQAMDYGIAYVPEDRHQHGLIMNFSIASNVTLPILQQVSRLGLIEPRKERKIAGDYSRQLSVRSAGMEQLVNALSGGNQQKVVLSKWLATNPSVLILDEPTRGIDVGAKAEVHRIISDLATRGLAIILISSELPEVLAMADRVIVLHEGHVTGTFARSEATQERVMFAATGQDR